MGEPASTWILKKTGCPHEWTDMLWEEAERVIRKEHLVPEREIVKCDCKAKIIVLPHPSGINTLATLSNKKLKTLLDFSQSI